MTHEQTADLLERATVRLSQSYCAKIENELDRRWDGDTEQADTFHGEAEEVRLLIEECRAAAAHIADDHSRVRRRGIGLQSPPPFNVGRPGPA